MESHLTDHGLIEAISIEVMGWHKDFLWKEGEWWFATEAPFRHRRESVKDWNPLTNANHWMMVVERMRELGWSWSIGQDLIGNFNIPVCNFYKEWPIESKYSDQSIGHAVCLASLNAIRGK